MLLLLCVHLSEVNIYNMINGIIYLVSLPFSTLIQASFIKIHATWHREAASRWKNLSGNLKSKKNSQVIILKLK